MTGGRERRGRWGWVSDSDRNKADNARPLAPPPSPHVPVKLVAQVMFRLKFLEALMNMSRSRFGCGKWGEDVKVNYHFITNNNNMKYERHKDNCSQKPFHCGHAHTTILSLHDSILSLYLLLLEMHFSYSRCQVLFFSCILFFLEAHHSLSGHFVNQ